MKTTHSIKIRFFALVLASVFLTLLFGGCTEVIADHKISVTSSNIQNGIVTGDGTYKTKQEVTLTATPKNNHSFVAWIRNELIVSYDMTYTFIASNDTDGKYTALFTTDTLDYFMLKKVQYNISGLTLNDEAWTLTHISELNITCGLTSGIYQELVSGKNIEMPNTGNLAAEEFDIIDKIFYMNKAYYFNIKTTYKYDINKNETLTNESKLLESDVFVDFSNLVSSPEINGVKNYANDDYRLTQTKTDNAYKVQLDFLDMNFSEDWDDESSQLLTLFFEYPFDNSEELDPKANE